MKKKKRAGFTLVEIMIVVAIIGVLVAIAIPNFLRARREARDARRKADIRQLQSALTRYNLTYGEYPLSGGASSPNSGWSNSSDSSWDTLQTELEGYIKKLPKDPVNETGGWTGGGKYNYCYFSRGYGCTQQWYMITYKLENPDIESPGVTACNGTYFNYGGTITVGASPRELD
ncbi:MAG: prepilin-type N-terminal cleavage/methylation domain-containing protein [Candidatus Ratteibacteria bacterium]|nr:prepilin-type N-terminal cleavage/methylation domain-containing protein [Candidatus Ratteibacteria bacterium]